MIVAAAFVPAAPILLPALTGGSTPELDELRAACRTAIRTVATPGRPIVLLGAGPRDAFLGPTSRGSLIGFGVPDQIPLGSDAPGPVDLPPSLTVGAWLVRDALGPNTGAAGWSVSTFEADVLDGWAGDGDENVTAVILGGGSARRTPKGPGYLDERAAPADATAARVLASGNGCALHDVNADLADDLLIDSERTWGLAAWSLEPFEYDAELLYDAAPFGVGYFVATWTLRPDSVAPPEPAARPRRPWRRTRTRVRLRG